MTKAQEVFEKVEAMTASGEVKKADAFKQLAEEYGQPVDSIRGSYYSHKRAKEGGTSGGGTRRTRRRETTTEVAVQSATAACGAPSTASMSRSRRQRSGPKRPRPSTTR